MTHAGPRAPHVPRAAGTDLAPRRPRRKRDRPGRADACRARAAGRLTGRSPRTQHGAPGAPGQGRRRSPCRAEAEAVPGRRSPDRGTRGPRPEASDPVATDTDTGPDGPAPNPRNETPHDCDAPAPPPRGHQDPRPVPDHHRARRPLHRRRPVPDQAGRGRAGRRRRRRLRRGARHPPRDAPLPLRRRRATGARCRWTPSATTAGRPASTSTASAATSTPSRPGSTASPPGATSLSKKSGAGQDVASELLEGAELVREAAGRARGPTPTGSATAPSRSPAAPTSASRIGICARPASSPT